MLPHFHTLHNLDNFSSLSDQRTKGKVQVNSSLEPKEEVHNTTILVMPYAYQDFDSVSKNKLHNHYNYNHKTYLT